jgi:hypothetical protein
MRPHGLRILFDSSPNGVRSSSPALVTDVDILVMNLQPFKRSCQMYKN